MRRETDTLDPQVELLQRLLHISAGTFSVSVAVCNSPALRDHVIDRVREHHPDLVVVRLRRESMDVYEEVLTHVASPDVPAVFVTGMELSVSSESERHLTLKSLNASRDLWSSRFHCPVVFWVPEYVAALMPTVTPDFWRFRSHGFEFVAPQWTNELILSEAVPANNPTLSKQLDEDQIRFRIAELEQRIENTGWPPPTGLLAYAVMWMQELSVLYSQVGETKKAEKLLRGAISVCAEQGWCEAQASLLAGLGNVATLNGNLDAAKQRYIEALAIDRDNGQTEGEARQLAYLGHIEQRRGNFNGAEQYYREALELNRRLGKSEAEAEQLGYLGHLEQARGNFDGAARYYHEALEINRQLGQTDTVATQLGNIGQVEHSRGNLVEAERLFRESLKIHQRNGGEIGEATQLEGLGFVAMDRGDLDTAEKYLREALDIERRFGRLEGEAACIALLGSIAHSRGDSPAADQLYREAAQIDRRAGNAAGQAVLFEVLGLLAWKNGNPEQAHNHWADARELYVRLGMSKEVENVQRRLENLLPA